MNDIVITTAAGVDRLAQPAGTVTVIEEDGTTFAGLTVDDGEGHEATVWLTHQQVTGLMVALGHAAYGL